MTTEKKCEVCEKVVTERRRYGGYYELRCGCGSGIGLDRKMALQDWGEKVARRKLLEDLLEAHVMDTRLGGR